MSDLFPGWGQDKEQKSPLFGNLVVIIIFGAIIISLFGRDYVKKHNISINFDKVETKK